MTAWQAFQQQQRADRRRRWEILRDWGRTAHDRRVVEQAERELERIDTATGQA